MGRLRLAFGLAVALAMIARPAIAQTEDPRPLVAVLVPLSGEFQAIGLRAWQAVAVAAARDGDIRLLRFDTAESGPAAAWVAAVEAGAHAVLGPIGASESDVVAALAAEGGPPVFLMNSVHAIERRAPTVFRVRTSPANQAAALAGTLLAEGTLTTFAVLAPDDAYGTESAEAFVRAVNAYGGTVVRVASYEAGEADVTDAVEVLVGTSSVRLRSPAAPWSEQPESRLRQGGGDRVRPAALFIPDYAGQVSAVLPHLRFHGWLEPSGAPPIRLLGLSGWASRDLQRVADLAAGAVITQVFDPDGLETSAEAFSLEWGVRFGEEPTAFEAQVFDAAHFLFSVLRSTPDRSPGSIAAAALAAEPLSGACGAMWFDADGGVVRELELWEVDGGGEVFPIGTIEPPRDRVPR